MSWLLALAAVAASIPAGIRWLRIAQREHYLAPAATRFALRWWTITPTNVILLLLAIAGVLGSLVNPWLAFLAVVAQVGPIGLGIKGVTSPLAWTSRLRRLAAVSGVLALAVYGLGAGLDVPALIAGGLAGLPLVVDLALVLVEPLEGRLGQKWVDRAARKLKVADVEVVAITGSYGKTTTKAYVAHLLSGVRRTLASPASFNNRMGLARAINENLTPDTEVFVAEMGTYGPGEIAALCRWIPPRVSALVAVGPVHLERFGTEERIVEAKAEIFEKAEVGVICVDDPRLAALAAQLGEAMEIVEVSTGDRGRVRVTSEG
ncbi:MAG: Mur ligase family protein, partial [Acidimicrobiia bacterium]